MASTFTVSRNHLIYGLCLPLALLLGYLLAEPLESSSLAVVVLVLSVLLMPLLMKWYHPALVLSWNSTFYIPLLSGSPPAWVCLVGLGMAFMVLSMCVDSRQRRFAGAGQAARPLIALGVVAFVTALLTGGIGLRVLGSSAYGGKKFVFIVVAIAGYFVMTSQRIPKNRAMLFVCLFFLSGATSLISMLAASAGGKLDALYYLITPGQGANAELGSFGTGMIRRGEWTGVSAAVCLFLLARFGIKGILDISKPWRLLLVLFFLSAGLLGGFRSFFGCLLLTFGIAFVVEGLHKTRYLFVALMSGALCLAGLAVFATKLPLSVQRSISFLPIEVSPLAADSATGTVEWRVDMWKVLVQDVPRYFFKGKGYLIDPGELYFSFQNADQGFDLPAEWAIVAGDYHNGPLSVIIPFGIWGILALGWFFYVCIRLLYRYAKYGDPELQTINRALFACFVARVFFFTFLVGGLSADLPYFVSVIGLAISLNGEPPQPDLARVENTGVVRSAFADI